MTNNFTQLEKALNYKFKNLALLEEALSHPSLKQIDNTKTNYERFELLGDSILGFLVTEMIFNRFNNYAEGTIAKIKAYVVSRDTLVRVANTLNLAEYIIMTSGEEHSGGRSNCNNIENTMEALLAAIYLDSNIKKTREIVNILWSDHIENIDFSAADPKTYLQEWLQHETQQMPTYEVIKQDGPMHAPTFTVQVHAGETSQTGTGHSIKDAEKNAARKMLKKLNQ
jgi:ribonuclease III